MMTALWCALAWSQSFPVQGTLTDAGGAPLTGVQTVNFRLATTGLGEVWSQSLAVAFVNGSFAAELGASGPPIQDAWLSDPSLSLSLALDGGAPTAPVTVGWAPRARYAARAGVASSVEGVLPRSNLPSQVAYTDGAATFNGAVSATSFTGSGAGLTGVPSSSITGANLTLSGTPTAPGHVVTLSHLDTRLGSYLPLAGGTLTGGLSGTTATFSGAVSAASFTGSGAGLTAVPSSSITGANLTLSGTPTAPGHVVTLSHLDTRLGSYLPLAGGTLTGTVSGSSATFSGAVRGGSVGVGMAPVRPLDVNGDALNVGFTSPAGPVRVILGNRDSAAIPGVILSANGEVQIGRGTAFANADGGTFTPALTTLSGGGVNVTGAVTTTGNVNVGGSVQQSGRTMVGGGLVHRDVAFFNTTSNGSTPIHIKTNIPIRSSHMYRIHLDGYNYGAALPIDHGVTGYMYASSSCIVSGAVYNPHGGTTVSQYCSSDGYLVVRVDVSSSYYMGFGVSAWFTNPVGPNNNFTVTFHHQSANL